MLATLISALLSAEAHVVCGAGYGEVTCERTKCCNGYRPRRRGPGDESQSGRVATVHAYIATGVNNDGYREILGLQVAFSENGAGGSPSSVTSWHGTGPR